MIHERHVRGPKIELRYRTLLRANAKRTSPPHERDTTRPVRQQPGGGASSVVVQRSAKAGGARSAAAANVAPLPPARPAGRRQSGRSRQKTSAVGIVCSRQSSRRRQKMSAVGIVGRARAPGLPWLPWRAHGRAGSPASDQRSHARPPAPQSPPPSALPVHGRAPSPGARLFGGIRGWVSPRGWKVRDHKDLAY